MSKKFPNQNKPKQKPIASPIVKIRKQSFVETFLENKKRVLLYQKIFLFLITFAVFANGIPNGFNLDDQYYTTEANPVAAMGVKATARIFTTHTLYDNSSNNFDYRPIPMLTFALQHQFISGSPQVSHFINVIIYAFICVLVFSLLCNWFGGSKNWFAFFVTLLYAVHPLHTEIVDSIKNRDELLATFFMILSMLSAWKWHKTNNSWNAVLSILLFITALICKKTVITYIAIMPLAFYFFTDMPVKRVFSVFIVLCVTFLAVMVITNKFLLPAQRRIFILIENPMYVTHQTFWVKSATACYILGWYLYLHLIPYPLSFYYGYNYVPLVNWSSPLAIISLFVYLFIVYFIVKNIKKKSVAVFGALVYLICIAPYSDFLKPVPGSMGERFTFAASLGFCIMFCCALYYLYKMAQNSFIINKNSKYFLATFLLILICYTAISTNRNTNWKDSITLYTHDIQHLQNSGKANMLYGEQIMKKVNYYRKMFTKSVGEEKDLYKDSALYYMNEERIAFKRVLAVSPNYNKALNNLAVSYIHMDSLEEAKKYLLKARSITPGNADINFNLGMVYGNLGMKYNDSSLIDSSIAQFKRVLDIDPKHTTAYKSLTKLLLRKGDTASAENTLLMAAKNLPDAPMIFVQLAQISIGRRDTVKAVYYYEKAAEVAKPNAQLYKLLQNYYLSKNNLEKANYYKDKLSQMKSVQPDEDD